MSFEGRKETQATRGSERGGRCERGAGALVVGSWLPLHFCSGKPTTDSFEGTKEVCAEREQAPVMVGHFPPMVPVNPSSSQPDMFLFLLIMASFSRHGSGIYGPVFGARGSVSAFAPAVSQMRSLTFSLLVCKMGSLLLLCLFYQRTGRKTVSHLCENTWPVMQI